jgi:hypothetical protein
VPRQRAKGGIGMERRKEIVFRIVKRIPKKTYNKSSIYDPVIKALLENPNQIIELETGSASGLRNALRRRFNGDEKVEVKERKGSIYVIYKPN